MTVRRAAPVVAVGVALVLLGGGCGGGGETRSLLGSPRATPTATTSGYRPTDPPTATDRTTLRGLLAQRAAAVLDDDVHAFLSRVGPGRPVFLARQRRLFDNLRLLPISSLSYRTDGSRILRSLALDGFGADPEVGPADFRVERRHGRLDVVPPGPGEGGIDPWDLTRIQVRSGSGVLAVFDSASFSRVHDVMSAVSHGITDVAEAVPGGGNGAAVVYAFADPAVLASYDTVPGGNLEHLGGISFPVRGGRHGHRVVGSRLALLPGALHAGRAVLGRIVRHELTHVAVGTRADGVPLWLSEGIAEYVAALPVPPAQRRIATVAVREAEAGSIVLPQASSFNGAAQALHYAVSWMACDYLAHRHGAGVLWRLLDAMRGAHVGRAGVGQGAVLRAVVGLGPHQLAEAAATRIRREFAATGSAGSSP